MKKKIRVSIIGTNGIPASYGGFETLAENLVKNLSAEFDFVVYCSKKQKNKSRYYENARLIYIPLNANGYQGLFYDVISLLHAFIFTDVILYLGPGIGGLIWLRWLFGKKVITNHGGLNEWERSKLNKFQKKFTYFNHKYAAKFSNINIVDNFQLKKSIKKTFGQDSVVIRYGGNQTSFVYVTNDLRKEFPFITQEYFLCVARAQVDNNLHLLIDAFKDIPNKNLVIVSNWEISGYGAKLKRKNSNYANIMLIDAIYDQYKLNAIRSNAWVYIHSHSECGTSPSLVEAICLNLPIISFDVPQNRETLLNNGTFFFKTSKELINIVKQLTPKTVDKLKEYSVKIKPNYSWEKISKSYSRIFNT